jgi:hypothetical protein
VLATLQLILLGAVLVAASVGCIVGVRRLTYWTRLDHYFIGEVAVTFAWVLPEYLIAVHAIQAAGALAYHMGDPYISVAATVGSAAANMLVIGLLSSLAPEGAGLETAKTSRPLGSAAATLLVTCLSVVGLGVTRADGMTVAGFIAGCFIYAVLFACVRMVSREIAKAIPIDADFLSPTGQGTLVNSVALAGASIVILAYVSLPFVELAIPWFRSGNDLPHAMRALLRSGLTIALARFMGIPDFIVSASDLRDKGADTPVPRLFISSAMLIAFTVVAGMNPDHLHDAFATSLFASFMLTVFVVALTVILLLAIPARLSARVRGMIVTGVALAGFAFSLLATGH